MGQEGGRESSSSPERLAERRWGRRRRDKQAAWTVGKLAHLPHSWPRVQREPADRLTSGYQKTAASAATAASPAAQIRQTSGDDGDASPVRWELPVTVLVALAQRSSSAVTGSADVPRGGRWPPRSLRVAQFFTPAGTAGRRGKASQRTPSAQARWEASRARTAGGHLAGKRRRPPAAAAGPSLGCLL